MTRPSRSVLSLLTVFKVKGCTFLVLIHSNVKVWDAGTGAKQYTFEGHEAPVYSVCPHYKENIQVSPPTL